MHCNEKILVILETRQCCIKFSVENFSSLLRLVDKCTKLVKTRDAERLREREEEEAAAEAAEKASSSDENKENEDMDEGSAETPAKESDKPVSKLDGGSMSVEKMD